MDLTTEIPPKDKFTSVAIVGKDMYVPIVAEPGDYYFKNFTASDRISIKGGDIICFDIGSKFRGVSVSVAEKIKSLDECKRLLLSDKKEGVQFLEAQKRLGIKSAKGIAPEIAQAQIVIKQGSITIENSKTQISTE